MQLSIVIPTYGRANDLQRTLESVHQQIVMPDEVLVVVGPGDTAGMAVAKHWQAQSSVVKVLGAAKKSVVHAMNLGFSVVEGDVICLLDDDVWIPVDYIAKVKMAYETDRALGAYGGRDHLQLAEPHLANPAPARLVGRFLWYGWFEGNHHCGVQDSPAQVDVLKGVNISFRRDAFPDMEIETALESQGAEICWEVDICQRIVLAGYNVVYDNQNYLRHYASPRSATDNRFDIFGPAIPARTYNSMLTMAKFRPWIEIVLSFLITFLLGSRSQPGIAWSILLIPKYGLKVVKLPWSQLKYMWRGTLRGLQLRKGVALRGNIPITIKRPEPALSVNGTPN